MKTETKRGTKTRTGGKVERGEEEVFIILFYNLTKEVNIISIQRNFFFFRFFQQRKSLEELANGLE